MARTLDNRYNLVRTVAVAREERLDLDAALELALQQITFVL